MFCVVCGSRLEEDDVKCPVCGTEKDQQVQQRFSDRDGTPLPGGMQVPVDIQRPTDETPVDPFVSKLPENVNTETLLLADWYTSSLALRNGTRYYEITMNKGSDDRTYFNEYIQNGDYTPCTHKAYLSSDDIWEEVLDKIRETAVRYDMKNWKNLQSMPMFGRRDVIKYTDENARLIRVSTDFMPFGGEGAFSEVEIIMKHFMGRAERVK